MHPSSESQNVVSLQTARSKRVRREHQTGLNDSQPVNKAGGFVIEGKDGAQRHLMTTRAGLNALKTFAQIGGLVPIYLSQQYFDAISQDSIIGRQ